MFTPFWCLPKRLLPSFFFLIKRRILMYLINPSLREIQVSFMWTLLPFTIITAVFLISIHFFISSTCQSDQKILYNGPMCSSHLFKRVKHIRNVLHDPVWSWRYSSSWVKKPEWSLCKLLWCHSWKLSKITLSNIIRERLMKVIGYIQILIKMCD